VKIAWLVKTTSDDDTYECLFEEPPSWYSVIIPIVYTEVKTGAPEQ